MGQTHSGDFKLEGTPSDGVIENTATTSPDGCQIALRVVSKFMFAADSGHCGGTNVSFDGLYRFRPGLE